MGAYLTNSLIARKRELQKEVRLGLARHERLKAMRHPSENDQARYIDLLEHMIVLVEAEMCLPG